MEPPTLPEELLSMVLENFAPPSATSIGLAVQNRHKVGDEFRQHTLTLYNACLASKSLHRVAWPLLYSGYGTHDYGGITPHPLPFVRTLCLSPHYGMSLRSLALEDWKARDSGNVRDHLSCFPGRVTGFPGHETTTALLRFRARSFVFHNYETVTGDLLHSLSQGLQESLVAMIMLFCPNIEELDIAIPLCLNNSLILDMLYFAPQDPGPRPPPTSTDDSEQKESDYILAQMGGVSWPTVSFRGASLLQNLRELTLRMPKRSRSFGYENFDLFINSLPQLRTLNMHDLFDLNLSRLHYDYEIPLRTPHSRLQEMSLFDCNLHGHEIAVLIKRFPSLSKLAVHWEHYPHATTPPGPRMRDVLEFGPIGRAIAESAPGLTFLVLDSPQWAQRLSTPDHPFVLGQTLRRMKNLTSICLNDVAVYGCPSKTLAGVLASVCLGVWKA